MERMTDEFNIPELMAKVDECSPYIVVAFQECERMNILTREIRCSLRELDLGLKVREVLGPWLKWQSTCLCGRSWVPSPAWGKGGVR